MRGPAAIIAWACVVEVMSMLVLSSYPAMIPILQADWGMSNVEAGAINGLFFAGQLVTVTIVTALTDRLDPKALYLTFLALGGAAALGFAFLADGFVSGAAWRLAEGMAIGGTYMPGLRILTDNVPDSHRSRATSIYTASYYLAAGLSFFLALWVEPMADWRWAIAACGVGPLAAFALALVAVPAPERRFAPQATPLDLRPALRNRRALGFALTYGLHNAELAIFASWLVPFLAFSRGLHPEGAAAVPLDFATIAALVSIIALPASITGNETAHKTGRQTLIVLVSFSSAVMAVLFGLTPALAFAAVVAGAFVYSAAIAFDSSAITGGMMATAEPAHKGTTMALYSIIGFASAASGPPLFGLVLDVAGGEAAHGAWIAAFACVAVCLTLQPLIIWKVVGGPAIRD